MFVLTTVDRFQAAYDVARKTPLVEAMTSPLEHTESTQYFLSGDTLSGFAIRQGDTLTELVYVFSLERGRGDAIVEAAIANGALHLDCFDGYLVDLYKRHGFREYNRVPNWCGDREPDVVFMSLRVSVWREKRYPIIRSLSA